MVSIAMSLTGITMAESPQRRPENTKGRNVKRSSRAVKREQSRVCRAELVGSAAT